MVGRTQNVAVVRSHAKHGNERIGSPYFRYDVTCSVEPRIFSSGFFSVTVVSGSMD